MARRYTDEDRALVKHLLDINDGNVKRTARDSGLPNQTVSDWKKRWERDGGPPAVVTEVLPAVVEKFQARATAVRDDALDALHEAVKKRELKGRDLVIAVGVLTDKIRVSEGKPTSHTEHSGAGAGSLPVEEVRELFAGLAKGMIEATHERRETISSALNEEAVDAEWTEQAPEALPASAS